MNTKRPAGDGPVNIDELAAIVRSSDDAIIGKTVEGIITSWNAGAERLYGYSAGEMIGRSIEVLIPSERLGEERLILKRVLAGHTVHPYHTQRQRKDGALVDISLTVSPIRDDSGRIVGASAIARDITTLRKREARASALIEAAPDAFIVVDAGGEIQFVNRQVEILFGYQRDELMGKTIEVLVPDRSRGKHPDLRTHYTDHPAARPMGAGLDLTGRRKDGTEFPIDISLAPLQTPEGLLVSAAVRDITERKRAEAKFGALLEAAPDAIIVVDQSGSIQIANHQTEKVFGYTREELLGKPVEMLIPTASRVRHPDLRSGYFTKPTVRPMGAGLQLFAVRKDGTEFPVDISLSPLETESGVLVSAAVRDITERLRAQEALRQAKEEAERANTAKSDFLSRMSHELRTPLAAILGFSELMQMHEVTPEQRKNFVDRTHKAGLHLLSLINDILDISRVEAGTLAVSIEPVELTQLIDDTLELVAPMAAPRNIHVLVDVAPEANVVRADSGRLKQVLLNLLSNAVKYNRDGGTVSVVREIVGDQLRVSVIDDGPGIPDEDLPRLFQPFERLGKEYGDVEGTGIGLALSSRLMELMGGAIGASSKAGEGSTFWIELPVAKLRTIPEVLEEPHAVQASFPKPEFTILYAEDNLSNFMLVEGILALRPHVKLISAIQGRLALDLVREHQPDLVLLDLNLPDISGEEVLKRLKADPATATIPVVVVSADAMPGRPHALMGAGAYAYVTKPLDIKQFLRVIDSVSTGT